MTTSPTSQNTGSCDLRDVHEHGWTVESAHSTSEGRVLYVRCAECGTRRVDLQQRPETPPESLTRTVSAAEFQPEQPPAAEPVRIATDDDRA
jgi:hypothetical protein